jgi:iron(III) transport system ATP-binding protein
MATAISIDGLSKVFGAGESRTVAVDRTTLEIGAGELFFLLGPSGCGKTTLLRMIAGFIEPSCGRIRFDGRDVTTLPANRRQTGMVFQSYALWPHMTVEANVAFGLTVRKVPAAERSRRVTEALEMVRMTEYAARRPNQLSGGQQQRVALARALVVRPDVLLLDEPLSNLDARLRIELRAEIRRICKDFGGSGSGITTIYVTHDQKEALSMSDRIAIMHRGRIAQVGTPRELYRHPGSRFVAEFLGETNFVEGTVLEGAREATTIDTPLGRLTSATPTVWAAGARLVCSLRPEALAFGHTGPNRLQGTVVESAYLGEVAQHTVDVNGVRLRVLELNPRSALSAVPLSVDPADVVLLPA